MSRTGSCVRRTPARDDRPWIFSRGRSVAAIETPPHRGGDDSAGAAHSRALPPAETTT